jgi:hypothetical protein
VRREWPFEVWFLADGVREVNSVLSTPFLTTSMRCAATPSSPIL